MYIHRQTDGRTEKAAEKHFLISATAKKERGGGEDEEGEMGTTCLHAVVDGRFQYGRIRMVGDISFYRFTGNRIPTLRLFGCKSDPSPRDRELQMIITNPANHTNT
jgi:hypothetical protein